MNHSVSVIIPVYNGQAYLANALQSVASQTVSDLEIIVIDDGSTDSTVEVVRSFGDPRLRYVHQDRAGAAAARNRGVELANRSLLTFLDADDVWTGDKLRLQLASLQRGDGDMIFTHAEEFISPDCSAELENQVRVHTGSHPFIYASTLLLRSADFQRVGPFDVKWKIGEFVEWYARAVDVGLKSAMLPQVLVRRRLHNTNTGRRDRALRGQYVQVIKSVLDRRRATLRQ